jgi:hypothetical protein
VPAGADGSDLYRFFWHPGQFWELRVFAEVMQPEAKMIAETNKAVGTARERIMVITLRGSRILGELQSVA